MGLTVPPTTTAPSAGTTNTTPPTTESSDTNQQDAFSQFMARMVNLIIIVISLLQIIYKKN